MLIRLFIRAHLWSLLHRIKISYLVLLGGKESPDRDGQLDALVPANDKTKPLVTRESRTACNRGLSHNSLLHNELYYYNSFYNGM